MISLEALNQIFAGGLLLFSVILMGKPRLPALLRHFALASLCLAGLVAVSTATSAEGDWHGYAVALGTVLFKVLLVPFVLLFAARNAHASMQLRFYARPAATYFICTVVLVVAWYLANHLPIDPAVRISGSPFLFEHFTLYVSVSLVLLGLCFMMIRRDLYSQIIGFLTMENGIAAFGALAVGGIPIVIEMGIFFTIMTGAILMAILSRQVQEVYASEDTVNLTELTG